MKLLHFCPEMPSLPKAKKRGRVMKGRPVTAAEFDKMLAAVPSVVGEIAAGAWRFWLRGLWWGGLRLSESLDLYWDRMDKLRIDLSGARPVFRVRAELEKGKRDRALVMAPEFAELLKEVPEVRRHGPVFTFPGIVDALGRPARHIEARNPDWIGRIATRIGKAASVEVDARTGGRIKYASAHDLRRSFGTRWAFRVTPMVLKEMMRHDDIKTTERYYADITAENIADVVYASAHVGSVFGSVSDLEWGEQKKQRSAKRCDKKS